MSRSALYTRLTRKGQTLLAQMHDLFDLACQSGNEIMATLGEDGAGHGPRDRNEIAEVLNEVARKDVGVVLAWTVDRSGRSQQHLVITPSKDARRHD